MKWNEYIELIGIVAVVLSLFLVAYELRQNTAASRQVAAAAYASGSRDVLLFVAGNTEFSDVLTKSIEGKSLSNEEFLRVLNFYRSLLRTWQDSHYQHLSGALDETLWQAELRFIEMIVGGGDPGLVRYWESEEEPYSQDFRRLINDYLQEKPTTQ